MNVSFNGKDVLAQSKERWLPGPPLPPKFKINGWKAVVP
jgi:hypothetical protein